MYRRGNVFMLSDDSWHPEEADAQSSEDELDYVPAQKKAKKQGPNKFTDMLADAESSEDELDYVPAQKKAK